MADLPLIEVHLEASMYRSTVTIDGHRLPVRRIAIQGDVEKENGVDVVLHIPLRYVKVTMPEVESA